MLIMYTIPLFPLNTVLFPGTPLALHIFEERYKLMMEAVLDGRRTFGVVMIRNGMESSGPLASPFEIGCTARVIDAAPLPDGRMNLIAVGEDRFRIHQIDRKLPYLTGVVESFPVEQPRTIKVIRGADILRTHTREYLDLVALANRSDPKGVTDGIPVNQIDLPDDPSQMVFLAASLLQIPAIEKQPILELESAEEITNTLIRMIKRELCVNIKLLKNDAEITRQGTWLN